MEAALEVSLVPQSWPSQSQAQNTLSSRITTQSEELTTLLNFSTTRSQRALDLGLRYSQEIQRGLLRVLQPPSALYPSIDFTAIRRTYNDSVARVQWRTKQVFVCFPSGLCVGLEYV